MAGTYELNKEECYGRKRLLSYNFLEDLVYIDLQDKHGQGIEEEEI